MLHNIWMWVTVRLPWNRRVKYHVIRIREATDEEIRNLT